MGKIETSPIPIRLTAILCGIFATFSCVLSIWAYHKFPHPPQITHQGKWGLSTEGFESFLFSYPVLQVAALVIVAIQTFRWKNTLEKMASQKSAAEKLSPKFRKLDVGFLYIGQCLGIVLFQIILSGLTVTNALEIAAGRY